MPDTGEAGELEISEPLPCERTRDKCLSRKRRAASWFFSHLDAVEGAGCTWLLCDPCKRNVDRLLLKADQLNYPKVVCQGCRKMISTEDIILRMI